MAGQRFVFQNPCLSLLKNETQKRARSAPSNTLPSTSLLHSFDPSRMRLPLQVSTGTIISLCLLPAHRLVSALTTQQTSHITNNSFSRFSLETHYTEEAFCFNWRAKAWFATLADRRLFSYTANRDCGHALRSVNIPSELETEQSFVIYDRGSPPPKQYPRFESLGAPFGSRHGRVSGLVFLIDGRCRLVHYSFRRRQV